MGCNNYNYDSVYDNMRPIEPFFTPNRPVRKNLEPILVARVFFQPIIEEIPNSAMSLTLNNTTTIANAFTHSDCLTEGGNDVNNV